MKHIWRVLARRWICCKSSDIALSPLVISDSSSFAGAGCYGIDLAEASSVHLYPITQEDEETVRPEFETLGAETISLIQITARLVQCWSFSAGLAHSTLKVYVAAI